ERGRVRRGYFVEGLGGAQFALPGAVDRLRAERTDPSGDRTGALTGVLLAATDPAQPYGGAPPWPRSGDEDRPGWPRAAGASVALVDGDAALYVDRGGRSIQTFPAFEADLEVAEAALAALSGLLDDGRLRTLQIERIDGVPATASRYRQLLEEHGFH